ncbi:unnamed protein product [Prorocentrum cordatum]|uniref:Uncharacterized protein n=1 Tax=Prorocentrum cordatum TaxID=2364126 RepID=A0ABN9RUR3_9DINO|nr:unnamed protein product [Polarella glacialis]
MASFSADEISSDLAGLPQGAFAGASAEDILEFAKFVCSDENAKAKHDLRFYTGTARAMAEVVQGVQMEVYADDFIRDFLKTGLVLHDKPFASSSPEGWKEYVLTPAMLSLALRAQGRFQSKMKMASDSDAAGVSVFANAMQQFVQATSHTAAAGSAKKGLSFDLAKRIQEMGLAHFPSDGLPSEETLAKFEHAGKVAAEKQRKWIGSADGECLQTHHRPEWSRTPVVAAPPTGSSIEEKLKHVLDDKKARADELKLDYQSYATFMGHVFQWGMKCVLMKACSSTELLAYLFNLTHIAEEHGGVRTAYQYDILQRKAMARSLERGEDRLSHYFNVLDEDMARKAKDKVSQKMKETTGRTTTGQAQHGGGSRTYGGSSSGYGGWGNSSSSGAAPKGQGKAHKGAGPAPSTPKKKRSRSPKRSGNGGNSNGKGGKGGHGNNQGNKSWQDKWWNK